MKQHIAIFLLLLLALSIKAQDKDTLEVQKIGDKYYVIVPHNTNSDSSIQAAVKAATTSKPFDSHFMVAGLGTVGFTNTWTKTTSGGIVQKGVTNTFGVDPQFEFSPMFIWRHSNNLLVEFEPSFDGTSLGVNWADITYFAYPGVIIRAGYLVLPFGTYNKRLAAGWIDKLATDPVGITSSPVSSDWGIEMEGGLPCGNMKVNYDIALTNGFQLLNDGSIQNPGITDNNLGKTVSGRFGWLPISNSSLELGISGLYGKAGDANTMYKNAATYMGAFDAQYVLSAPHAVMNLKGQYNAQYVSNESYNVSPGDTTTPMYSFTNFSQGYFAQISVRPVVPSKFLRNLEFAARYSAYYTPKNSTWENQTGQASVGVSYWINWRTVLKVNYENVISSNPLNANLGIADNKTVQNMLMVQFSVQF
jgi:hypothetical protein